MRNASFSTVHGTYILFLALICASSSLDAQRPSTSAGQPASASIEAEQALAVQVALDRAGFSPGEIDGRTGPKTRLALSTFQQASKLRQSGALDEETLAALRVPADPILSYTITQQDLTGPFIGSLPQDMMERAKLPALAYSSALEALAEKFHSSPALLQRLNPGASWSAGAVIKVPNVEPFDLPSKTSKPAAGAKAGTAAAQVIISGATKSLVVKDAAGKTLMHAPITIGSQNDPPPLGEWKVVGVSWNPVFNYNPDLFWDADPAHAKAKLQPGPNNPVGVVWIDINKQHFGLHGTPEPAAIGRTESHGCIRLTNWDATKLGRLVSVGTRVSIK
jgi:lipoprotein-anchoring transpeptidase ErfK/SrfK